MVDTVLYLEGERHFAYRVLRTVKNRFGSTDEIGIFEMREEGLKEVKNPSSVLIEDRESDTIGTVVVSSLEGTRPILLELQALTTRTAFGMPRRSSSGIDTNKLNLMLAVIEKYAGKFPTWLCPEQVRILPISDKYADYANSVLKELKKNGIDATVDTRTEKIGFKIRDARLARLPYMLVVGEKEEAEGSVSVRSRFAGDEGSKKLSDFVDMICKEIRTKEIRKEEVTE